MTATSNLRHLTTSTAHDAFGEPSEVEAVFQHWVWMFGHSRNRVALGPTRKKVISKALALYGVDTLMLAIDGCASSKWHAGDNDRDRTYQDIELILRNEEHIERFAQWGDDLRKRAAARERELVQSAALPIAAADPQRLAEDRERVRMLAAQLRAGAR